MTFTWYFGWNVYLLLLIAWLGFALLCFALLAINVMDRSKSICLHGKFHPNHPHHAPHYFTTVITILGICTRI